MNRSATTRTLRATNGYPVLDSNSVPMVTGQDDDCVFPFWLDNWLNIYCQCNRSTDDRLISHQCIFCLPQPLYCSAGKESIHSGGITLGETGISTFQMADLGGPSTSVLPSYSTADQINEHATSGAGDLESWIAIEPLARSSEPLSIPVTVDLASPHNGIAPPPTFRQSQFDVVLRRQRMRLTPTGAPRLKTTTSRFLNLSSDFEFAGWGSFSRVKLSADDHAQGEDRLARTRSAKVLGRWTGTALPGNAVLGSVFYALPAVVAVCGVYAPISLFAATLTPFIWRPIMEELGSALPICGAPYAYLLNVTPKSIALLGAALMLLDFASTSVVSASTAASYVAGEVALPFPDFVGAAVVLLVFAVVSFTGLKESARISFVVLAFHMSTMAVLSVCAVVCWGRQGNEQLRTNWVHGQAKDGWTVARQLFNGFCLGMLGLTGIECAPSYIGRMRPGAYPAVLRNLHLPAVVLNSAMILLVFAVVPMNTVLSGANVLICWGLAAEVDRRRCNSRALRWSPHRRVLSELSCACANLFAGILSACELFEQLSHDRILPRIFQNALPFTGAPYVSIVVFTAVNAALYASSGASLAIVSKMFSLVWLTVMGLFPLALLLLRFSRGRLECERSAKLWMIMLAFAVTLVVFAGNIAIDPSIAGYFAAYLVGVLLAFGGAQNHVSILRALYWLYDQYPWLHMWPRTQAWGPSVVRWIQALKKQPVCVLVKTDEINRLLHLLLYVRENEQTSCVKLVHFCDEETGVPSELEANAKILDEAFPEITIDLILVSGAFSPSNVGALAHRLQIPTALMFISCPGPKFPYSVADFGTRIISL
ncbi:unnamed protein product [Mycena citricolor]|uniref:AAAP amino acid permease n=1 Tax=Mycena citricolor TaxID=2018698 RepID=A0AAD2HXH1_9AGAR|nr:unnamed protein product [Mycena citricolor]CAK5282932.1 unnamed protein product [Mycena citricolor]